jgi:hypothetical protein
MNMRALLRSLFDTYPVALGIGLPAVALLYAAIRGLNSHGFLYAGLVFQLAGLVTVVVGIGKTRAEFGESWRLAFTRWLERTAIAAGLKKPAPIHGSVATAEARATARAEGTVGLPADATPDQRFAFLQERIEWLRKRIQATEVSVDTERNERATAIEVERNQRQSGDSEVKEQVRRLAMGGVDLSFLGAFWLGFGIVFATIPEQLANYIGHHP